MEASTNKFVARRKSNIILKDPAKMDEAKDLPFYVKGDGKIVIKNYSLTSDILG